MKKGYLIVRISITDDDFFQKYPPLSASAIKKYNGKYLIRGGKFDVLEGDWPVDRTTVVEFDSYEIARECYESLEYANAKEIRQQSTKSDFILIEGY